MERKKIDISEVLFEYFIQTNEVFGTPEEDEAFSDLYDKYAPSDTKGENDFFEKLTRLTYIVKHQAYKVGCAVGSARVTTPFFIEK